MSDAMESWVPPPGWRTTFEEQATQKTIDRATVFAHKRTSFVRRIGRRADALYARELVLDALGDIFDGRLSWDPSRKPLLAQLQDVVLWRTEYRRSAAPA